jgi:uncharacterized membrane protein YkoI
MKKIVVIVLVILIVGTGSWYGVTQAWNQSDSLLSEEKVSQLIQQKYGGTIETIRMVQENEQPSYTLTLIKDQISYDMTVNAQTGEVLSLVKQKSAEQKTVTMEKEKTKENSEQEQIVGSNEKNQSPSSSTIPITEEQAKIRASEKVSGTITSIELEDEDDQLVYEVEIDQSKTKEATVIINAYSGKVESITFETEDND